jgi:hypothetical protein
MLLMLLQKNKAITATSRRTLTSDMRAMPIIVIVRTSHLVVQRVVHGLGWREGGKRALVQCLLPGARADFAAWAHTRTGAECHQTTSSDATARGGVNKGRTHHRHASTCKLSTPTLNRPSHTAQHSTAPGPACWRQGRGDRIARPCR